MGFRASLNGFAGMVAGSVWLAASTANAAGNSEIVLGWYIAEVNCSGCHQVRPTGLAPTPYVDDDNRAIGVGPSFLEIAATYRGDPVGLRASLKEAHYPMPEPGIAASDLDPLVGYILRLRASAPGSQ